MDKGDVIVVVIVSILITIMAYGSITGENIYEMTLVESVNIYSTSLHSDFEFTLWSGESHFNYYYFTDWGNGKKLDCVPVSNTKIIETDDEIPNLKRYKIKECRTFYSKDIKSCFVTYYNELTVPTNTTQVTFRAEV